MGRVPSTHNPLNVFPWPKFSAEERKVWKFRGHESFIPSCPVTQTRKSIAFIV